MSTEKPKDCAGCGYPIEPGQEAIVTVTKGSKVKSVHAHEEHRDAAYRNTYADRGWTKEYSAE